MAHRTVAILTAVLAAATYAILWTAVALHWKWLNTIDCGVLDPLHAYGVKRPGWVRFWNVLSTVFGPEAFRLLGAAAIIVAVLRRHLRAVLFVLTAIELSGAVAQLGKNLTGRPRPAGALTVAVSSAFPSGHAVAVMAAVLTLLTLSAGMLTPRGRTSRTRTAAIALGSLLVITIGAARVILNAHYPSDVVAGWALGYLWYLVCLLAIRPGTDHPDAASQLDPHPAHRRP
jgi:membrane-associated phospholipid phosphatase